MDKTRTYPFLAGVVIGSAALLMLKFLLVEWYLALHLFAFPLFFLSLFGVTALMGRRLTIPRKRVLVVFALVSLVLAPAVAFTPLPYEVNRVARQVPVPEEADPFRGESWLRPSYWQGPAIQYYRFPPNRNAPFLFEETIRLAQEDGWQIVGIEGPYPPDFTVEEPAAGTFRASKPGLHLSADLRYVTTGPSPATRLAIVVAGEPPLLSRR